MRNTIVILSAASAAALFGCSSGGSGARANTSMHGGHAMESAAGMPVKADVMQAARTTVDVDTARLRAATAAFRSIDAAFAAGYPREIPGCIAHPTLGGMGYHLVNAKLVDDNLEVEKPEILVYEKTPSGGFKLNGVEYMVPFSAHPRDKAPPAVMGHQLKPYDEGQFWFLHVWAWTDNPSGLYADWNPNVKC